jgi:hypothetical protein
MLCNDPLINSQYDRQHQKVSRDAHLSSVPFLARLEFSHIIHKSYIYDWDWIFSNAVWDTVEICILTWFFELFYDFCTYCNTKHCFLLVIQVHWRMRSFILWWLSQVWIGHRQFAIWANNPLSLHRILYHGHQPIL